MATAKKPTDPISRWVSDQSTLAWNRIVSQYGAQPQQMKNAFFHVYSSAILAKAAGPAPSLLLGELRELNTWKAYSRSAPEQRDTWKDLYNDKLGIEIQRHFLDYGLDQKYLDRGVYDALVTGKAVVYENSDSRVPSNPGKNLSAVERLSGILRNTGTRYPFPV